MKMKTTDTLTTLASQSKAIVAEKAAESAYQSARQAVVKAYPEHNGA